MLRRLDAFPTLLSRIWRLIMLGQVDVLLTLPFISRWSTMPVRLDAYLTSCRLQVVVQQYLGRWHAFPKMPFRRGWLINNGGTNRCATDIAIQNLMANNAGTIRYASDISIHKSMVNYVGTFRSWSDKLPSISCSTVLMGRLDAFPTLPFRSLAFNLAPSTRLVPKNVFKNARLSNIAIQKLLMESVK